MRWTKVLGKFVKTALLAGSGAGVAAIQQMPAGEVQWETVAAQALTAAVLAGLGAGGINARKHWRT